MTLLNGATPVDAGYFQTKSLTAVDAQSTAVCFLLVVCGNQSGTLTINTEINSKQIANLVAELDYLEVSAARADEFGTPGATLQPYPTLGDIPISDAIWILPFQSPLIQPVDNLNDPINAWDGFYCGHMPAAAEKINHGLRYTYKEYGDADLTYAIEDLLSKPIVPSFETHRGLTTLRGKSVSAAFPKFPKTHSGICDIMEITNGQDVDHRYAKKIWKIGDNTFIDPTKKISPPTGASAMFGFEHDTDTSAAGILIGVKNSPEDTNPYLIFNLTGLRCTTASMDKWPVLNKPDLTAIYTVTVCLGGTNELTGNLASSNHVVVAQPYFDYANSTSSTEEDIYACARLYDRPTSYPTNYPVYATSPWRGANTSGAIKNVVTDFRPLLPFTITHKIYEFNNFCNSYMLVPRVGQLANFLTPQMDADNSDLSIVEQAANTIDEVFGTGTTQQVVTQLGNVAKQKAVEWTTQQANNILNGIGGAIPVKRNVLVVKSHTAGQAARAQMDYL